MGIKVSALDATTDRAGCLVLLSVPDGAGGYTSKHITYENLFVDAITSSNLKRNVENISTGNQKITFTGDAFSSSNYVLLFTCYLNGLKTPLELVSRETDGFTLNNTMGVSVEVDYTAYSL